MDRDSVEHNRRMDDIADRLQARFADAAGLHVGDDEIDELVHLKADAFADARLQEFVPLLVEHQASDALRDRGMRPVDLDDPNAQRADEAGSGPERSDSSATDGDSGGAGTVEPPVL